MSQSVAESQRFPAVPRGLNCRRVQFWTRALRLLKSWKRDWTAGRAARGLVTRGRVRGLGIRCECRRCSVRLSARAPRRNLAQRGQHNGAVTAPPACRRTFHPNNMARVAGPGHICFIEHGDTEAQRSSLPGKNADQGICVMSVHRQNSTLSF